jgi:hypothetical protein
MTWASVLSLGNAAVPLASSSKREPSLSEQAKLRVGVDGDGERAAELRPDRYYLLGDAGSFFFEPGGDNEGFRSPEAVEWASTQTVWPELDSPLPASRPFRTIGTNCGDPLLTIQVMTVSACPDEFLCRHHSLGIRSFQRDGPGLRKPPWNAPMLPDCCPGVSAVETTHWMPCLQ